MRASWIFLFIYLFMLYKLKDEYAISIYGLKVERIKGESIGGGEVSTFTDRGIIARSLKIHKFY